MKNRILASAAVAALLLAGCVWLLTRAAPRGPVFIPAVTASDKPAKARDVSVAGSAANTSPAPAPSRVDWTAPVDPAHTAEVRAALDELKKIYSPAGALDWDQAKALIAQREKATRELADKLAQLGPGGARALAAGYHETDGTRAKLLLVQALGKIDDSEAAGALQALLGLDPSFSLRKEIVLALGQRKDDAAEQALAGLLASPEDAQLRFASAQALSGRASALPVLAERLRNENNSEVQKELVRSVGLVGNNAAMAALAQIAQRPGAIATRQTAIQELGRTFGVRARSQLDRLLNDPDEAIRTSATKAVARIDTGAARTRLQPISAPRL